MIVDYIYFPGREHITTHVYDDLLISKLNTPLLLEAI